VTRPIYSGPLDRNKMSRTDLRAYEAYNALKARSKKQDLPNPSFTAREFIAWWTDCLKDFKGTIPTCGRIDHSLGYSWDNMEMQDMADNSRESARRNKLGANNRTQAKMILVKRKSDGVCVGSFGSVRMAARYFGVSQRLVQFIVRGECKQSKKIAYDLEAA